MARIWIGSIVLFYASTVLSAQRPMFTSGIDVVHLGISIFDDDDKPVPDVTADDVELYEDGVLQEIRYFSRGMHTDNDVMPMHLGLLFDASSSMGEDDRFAKTAAIKFLNTLTYAEDMTLVDFDDTVRVGRYDQDDFPRLVERIRNREPGGMTAFYDALGVYLDGAFDLDGRKVLLVYSDGYDTRSRMPFSDTLELLKASDVTVYAIGFQGNIPRRQRPLERMKLGQLVELTGGRVFFPNDVDALDEIYEAISEDLETRYALGYVSTNTRMDGTWRRIEIEIKPARPELLKVETRSREGYYARYQDPESPDR